jgi:hypothetical protein
MANILYRGKSINNYYWGIPDPLPPGSDLVELWTPKNASGLQFWVEALGGSLSLELSGSNVTRWFNLFGYSSSPTGLFTGTSPTYTYNEYVSFDGINDALLFPSGFMHNWAQFSMFFLMAGPLQNNDCFFGPRTNAQVGLELIWTNVISFPTLCRINNVDKFTSGLFSDDSNFAITSLVANSTVTVGRKNGNSVTAANSAGISPLSFNGEYALGQYASNFGDTFFGQFDIKELLIYDTTLSSDDTEKVEGYLAYKWGYASLLPLTHPYKDEPPFLP